jgi:putrescine transport system ATP-binding protein
MSILAVVLGCILVLVTVLLALSPGKTKPFPGADGMPLAGSVSEKIRVRRDALTSTAAPDRGVNRAHGTIKEIAYFGSFTVYHLQMASGRVLKISQSNVERQAGVQLTWGDAAWATWTDLSHVVLTQ